MSGQSTNFPEQDDFLNRLRKENNTPSAAKPLNVSFDPLF
jgi:hypothetical protein